MRKECIEKIFGDNPNVIENDNANGVIVSIKTNDIDVCVTVPYDVSEILWEAKNKEGTVLVQDNHDFDGDTEYEDIKENLLDLYDVMKAPKFRVVNEGKTLEAYSNQWYYFFGEFNS